MSGRLAIDFGTSNTVIALWDASSRQGIPLHLPGYARVEQQGSEPVAVVPSVIHYGTSGQRTVANEVLAGNLYHSPQTFRWMKRYIMQRNPTRQRVHDREISYAEAGSDFLAHVISRTREHAGLDGEEVAFTVPVESFEHYVNWLAKVLGASGIQRFRVIDEPSAAAIGYGIELRPGDVYLVFDFGCGTLDVAVVMIELDHDSNAGCRCRVLGKAGADLGGAEIDKWLYQHVLDTNGIGESDESLKAISRALLVECERAKERLSSELQASISVMNPYTGSVIEADVTRSAFEELLDQHNMYSIVGHTIRRALATSRERGYDLEHIKAALMVGGSSLIPSVQRALHQHFGRERVKLNRPLDAVARGAAAFVAGMRFTDHIQHDYAIKHLNPRSKTYEYRVLVKRGTQYPTGNAVDEFYITASADNQSEFGINIYELSETACRSEDFELQFDENGTPRLVPVNPNDMDSRRLFWMNERQPTFLTAESPARAGQTVFRLSFGIDQNKRLLVTAKDVRTGTIVRKDYPVVRLS